MKRIRLIVLITVGSCMMLLLGFLLLGGFKYVLGAAGMNRITCETRFPTDEAIIDATPEQMARFFADVRNYAADKDLKYSLSDLKRRAETDQFMQVYNGNEPLLNAFGGKTQIKIMLYDLDSQKEQKIESLINEDFGSRVEIKKIIYASGERFRCK